MGCCNGLKPPPKIPKKHRRTNSQRFYFLFGWVIEQKWGGIWGVDHLPQKTYCPNNLVKDLKLLSQEMVFLDGWDGGLINFKNAVEL